MMGKFEQMQEGRNGDEKSVKDSDPAGLQDNVVLV